MKFKYNIGDLVFIKNSGHEYTDWSAMQEKLYCPKNQGLNRCIGNNKVYPLFDPRGYEWGDFIFTVRNRDIHPTHGANVYYVSCEEGYHAIIGEEGLHRNILMMKGNKK